MGRVACILLLLPALLAGAEDTWENLERLRAGQRIQVSGRNLKPVQGEFLAYTPAAISLTSGGSEVVIPRSDVFSIRLLLRSHRGRNALLGLGLGAASGLVAGAIRGATYHEAGETGVFVLVLTPIGAGIGAGLGAAMPTGPVTVYRVSKKPD